MRERAALLLEASPDPVPSARLALDLLGLASAPASVCKAVIDPLLAPDPRFARAGEDRWTLSEPDSVPGTAPAPPALWTWAVFSAEPDLRAAAVVRWERGAIVSERLETAAGPSRASLARMRRGAPPRARISSAAWTRLAHCARGAHWVSADRDTPLSAIRAAMKSSGERTEPELILPLARLTRALLGLPATRPLEEIASALGAVSSGNEDPLQRARLAGECLLRLLERPEASSLTGPDDLVHLLRSRAVPFNFAGREFDSSQLRLLPEEAGTYRFVDRAGNLLYVGQSKNLRRRVSSYFLARTRPDPRTSAWLARVHRIEIEPSASSLEALLREADQILRSRPMENRQRRVHAREHAPASSMILVLPARTPGRARAHLIRDGIIAGGVTLSPRGGGAKLLRRKIEEVFFGEGADAGRGPQTSPPAARSSSWKAPAGKHRSASESDRRASAILSSWLRRMDGSALAFDPTEAAGPEQATARAIGYARSLLRGEGPVFHR